MSLDIKFTKLAPASKAVEVPEDDAKDFADLYAAQADHTKDYFGVIGHETKGAKYKTLAKAKAWAADNELVTRLRRLDDDTSLALRFEKP